jgi:RNA polymerase sigma-70 factor (ECF subfamily)
LYEQHSGRVFKYCLRWLRSREEAEDAVQTTFLYAMRGLRRGVVPLFDEAWLLAIARNVCRTRTEVTRRRAVEVVRDPHVLAESVAAPAATDDLDGLSEALTGLTEAQRRAILLREWQGLSYREIAAELDLSQAAVETLLFRARRALAARLRVAGYFVPWLKSLAAGGAGKLAVVATVVTVTAVGTVGDDGRHDRHDRVPARATSPALHTSVRPGISPGASPLPSREASARAHTPTRSRADSPVASLAATTSPTAAVPGVDPAPGSALSAAGPPAAGQPTAGQPTAPTRPTVPRAVSDATQTVADATQPVTDSAGGAVQAVVATVTDAAGAVGPVETVASAALAVATVAAAASTAVPQLPAIPAVTVGGVLSTP